MAQMKWQNDLSGGMNQYASPDLIADNQSLIAVNVSQSELGNWAHRNGTDVFGASISATGQIRGLGMYMKNDGTFYLHAVHQGNIYIYDENSATFTQQVAQANAGIGVDSDVEWATYINRHYYIGSGNTEYLRYVTETGGSTLPATVLTGTVDASSSGTTLIATSGIFTSGMVGFTIFNTTDTSSAVITAFTSSTTVELGTSIGNTWDGDAIAIYMDGKYLATNGAFLMVAAGTTHPLRSYWSNLESQTFDVTADYAITTTVPTGVASFGSGRPFIVFTENTYLTVDPNSGQTDEVEDFGCVSHRSIANLKGTLIWLGRTGFYTLAYNQAYPTEVSLPIRNDETQDAIINQIDPTKYEVTAAGVKNNRYYCALRDLAGTVQGQTLNDCVVEFDYAQQTWRVHTYTQGGIGTVFSPFILDGQQKLLAGSIDNGTVYEIDYDEAITDQNRTGVTAAVTTTIRTKPYEFGGSASYQMKNIAGLYYKYYCPEGGSITVSYSLDGNPTYTALPTVIPASPAGQDWDWRYHAFGKECRSISLQFESTADFKMFAVGLNVETLSTEGISPI